MKSILKKVAGTVITAVLAFGMPGCNNNIHEHTYSDEWSSDGTFHWHAATCEHPEEETGKEPHSFGEWIITEPSTEETEGEKEHTCEVCGITESGIVPVLDHVHVKGATLHEAVPSTCATRGTVAYYDCAKSTCQVKLDEDGNPLDTIEAELDPENHEGTATTWTKTDASHLETYDCCNAVKTALAEHTWDSGVVIKASTCGEAGAKKYTCTVCHVEKTEEIAKLPHTYAKEWINDETFHWHAATCEHKEEVQGKEAHKWNGGVVTKAATEYAKGEKICTCDVCSTTRTEVIPIWYESPVDAETGNAATSSSKYIYFGVFPRTVLPLDSTVTVDENDKVEMGANTYFKGSDGEYYAKALENAYDTGAEYKYKNGEQAKLKSAGSYRYFKVEPIKWKVLTTAYDIDGEVGSATGALLLAEDILTSNVHYYEDAYQDRTIDGKTVYGNNYKHSQIRAYLNGLTYQRLGEEVAKWKGNGFLQTAFTEAAQGKIVTTTVDNSGASTTDATGFLTKADGSNTIYTTDYTCGTTSDKIFLLSEREVTTTAYGFAAYDSCGQGNARIRMPTDYAKANYAYQSPTAGYGGYWWLRSPRYMNISGARHVDERGYAFDSEYVYCKYIGVVPALSISF